MTMNDSQRTTKCKKHSAEMLYFRGNTKNKTNNDLIDWSAKLRYDFLHKTLHTIPHNSIKTKI